jgi:hypothetical protein
MKTITRYDYIARRMAIARYFGTEDVEGSIIALYVNEGLCAQEIVDMLAKAGINITVRTIQRILNKNGKSRTVGEAYRLSMKRGRMHWIYKDARMKARKNTLSSKTRFSILKRDNYKCVLCGNTAQNTILEVDHIIALVNGGKDDESNLRTLCHDCNFGKKIVEKER